MQITRDKDSAVQLVHRCEPGLVIVGRQHLQGHFILSTSALIEDWRPANAATLTTSDLQPALELSPEVIVLGTGETQRFPPQAVMAAMLERGIGLEVMDTRAACRTYNILALDGRQVVAAILQISAE